MAAGKSSQFLLGCVRLLVVSPSLLLSGPTALEGRSVTGMDLIPLSRRTASALCHPASLANGMVADGTPAET